VNRLELEEILGLVRETKLSWGCQITSHFSTTFCRYVIIEILLHAYFECFLEIVVWHILSNKYS